MGNCDNEHLVIGALINSSSQHMCPAIMSFAVLMLLKWYLFHRIFYLGPFPREVLELLLLYNIYIISDNFTS